MRHRLVGGQLGLSQSDVRGKIDVQAQGKWAFEGKLEDLSDILVPMKSAFAPNTLETALLYNDVAKKKAYYGFPLKQQSMHVQIWQDMLEQVPPAYWIAPALASMRSRAAFGAAPQWLCGRQSRRERSLKSARAINRARTAMPMRWPTSSGSSIP